MLKKRFESGRIEKGETDPVNVVFVGARLPGFLERSQKRDQPVSFRGDPRGLALTTSHPEFGMKNPITDLKCKHDRASENLKPFRFSEL
jgi:hypothetical protein